jgi:hypothetical protein
MVVTPINTRTQRVFVIAPLSDGMKGKKDAKYLSASPPLSNDASFTFSEA